MMAQVGEALRPAQTGQPVRTVPPLLTHRYIGLTETSGAMSAASALRRAHLSFVHAEVVRDLVPHGVFHHPREMLSIAGQALVRALKDDDLVRHREGLEDAALRQRAAAIQAEQAWTGRVALHYQRDIVHAP